MKIAKLALITALLGVIALIILSYAVEPKLQDVSEISKADLGNFVKITGQISNLKQSKITSFDLSDQTGEIIVVSFEKLDLSNKDNLEIIGKVDQYYGRLEVKVRGLKRLHQ